MPLVPDFFSRALSKLDILAIAFNDVAIPTIFNLRKMQAYTRFRYYLLSLPYYDLISTTCFFWVVETIPVCSELCMLLGNSHFSSGSSPCALGLVGTTLPPNKHKLSAQPLSRSLFRRDILKQSRNELAQQPFQSYA